MINIIKQGPIKARNNTAAAAKCSRKNIISTHNHGGVKHISRHAHKSERCIHLVQARQAPGLTVPLSRLALISYQYHLFSILFLSAWFCSQMSKAASHRTTDANGFCKTRLALLQNNHHAIHLWRYILSISDNKSRA